MFRSYSNKKPDSLILYDTTDTGMTAKKIVLISIMTTSNLFMLFGNAFSIYIILRSRFLRKRTYYWLVLNLAVLDLMNSLSVVPMNIVWEFYGYWPFNQPFCDTEIFFDLGFSTVAAYSTVLLSLDKYFYILKPFFYHTYVGSKTTLISIFATWIIWMTYSAASVFGGLARSKKAYKYNFPLDRCNFVLKHAYAITSFFLVFFIPLVILIFTSTKILCIARHHIRKIHANHVVKISPARDISISMYTTTITDNVDTISSSIPCSFADISSSSATEPAPGKTHLDNITDIETTQKSHFPFTVSPTTLDSEGSSGVNTNSKKVNRKEKQYPNKLIKTTSFRAFRTLILVVTAYIIMFAPYWIATVINLGCLCIQPIVFDDYLSVFYYMHSLVNPYIYMATDRRYKKAIQLLMAKLKLYQRCRTRMGKSTPNIQITFEETD